MCIKKTLWLLPLLFVTACASHSGKYASETTADSTPGTEQKYTAAAVPPSATTGNLQQHKFVHTANFQCKVQDVFNSTIKLEQLVRSVGGIVVESNMNNSTTDTKTMSYKEDSLRQIQTYTTSAIITVRVPSLYLDSVTNAIPAMSTFIDSRSLKQSDMTYGYLRNELKNQQDDDKKSIAQAHTLAKKSSDAIAVQQYEKETDNEKISEKIDNMQIQDNVDYATVYVTFSQPERVYVQAIVNAPFFSRVPFSEQCKAALNNGCGIVSALAVGIMSIWPLLLLTGGIWLVYKKVTRKKLLAVE